MKEILRVSFIAVLFVCGTVFFFSCEKEQEPVVPTVSTAGISAITLTTASTGGDVTADGGAAVTARGVCWGTDQNPTTADSKTSNGTGTGSFTSNLTGLMQGTQYYVRAWASNSAGTAYGNQQSFTTIAVELATLTTAAVSSYTESTAVSGGNITDDGGGDITERGVCWSSTSQTPTVTDSKTEDGSGIGAFTSNLTGLDPETTYYIRAYATNSAGTAYGDAVSFTTLATGQAMDADGNIYNSVTIGSQVWMVKNLRTTKFNDGTDITDGTGGWDNTDTPVYCWYDDDSSSYADSYGALYNWYAVASGKLCPPGWHIPGDEEWTQLTDYLGGESVAGGKLKETGTTHWSSPNTGATNETGFTALPGGYGIATGIFNYVGVFGLWWSATEATTESAWDRDMANNTSIVTRVYNSKELGISVRCLRD